MHKSEELRNLQAAAEPKMPRAEIQKFGKKMAMETEKGYCLHGGKMQIVYKDVSFSHNSANQYDQKYL
jgi:hypothetical protein